MTSPNPFDIEHALVLACALAPEADEPFVFAHRAARGGIDWKRLCAVATAHGLRPVVARAIAHARVGESEAQATATDLREISRANAGRGKLLAGELLQILGALVASGIPAIPYKGPALEHALGSTPGLREMSDLDLFVRAENLAAATCALETLGYAPALPRHALLHPHFDQVTPEWLLLRPADGLLIELHCRVTPPWFPAPCSLDDIEARQQTLTFAGQTFAWPAPEELLLIHMADGMKSCGRGMKWIGDVARILRRNPGIDWVYIRDVASRHGGLNVVRVALALVIDCCIEIAGSIEMPEIGVAVAPQAEALAADARRTRRLATALEQIRSGILHDVALPGAMAHFRWSIRLSDHPLETVAAIARYLAGPAIADLAQAPATGRVLPLPMRAFLRRVRAAVSLRQ